jgi:hypothetical protein
VSAQWFTTDDHGLVPIERAVLGESELSVRYIGGGEWQWLVDRDGRAIAEGAASSAVDAREQAEAVAIAASLNLS